MAVPLRANDVFLSVFASAEEVWFRALHEAEPADGTSPVSRPMWTFNAAAMPDGPMDAVEAFLLGARDPNKPNWSIYDDILNLIKYSK